VRVLAVVAASCLAACDLGATGLGVLDDTASDAEAIAPDSSLPAPTVDGQVDDGAPEGDSGEGHPGTSPDSSAPSSTHDAAPEDSAPPGSPIDAASPVDASPPVDAPSAVDSSDATPPAPDAGDALSFANGAYVEVGALPIPADFTLEAWVNPASSNGTAGETEIVAEDRTGQSAGQLRLGITAGALFFMMSNSAGVSYGLYNGTGYALQTSQTLAPGVWSHIAVTKSGASFVLYIGAAQVSTFTAMSALTYGGPSTAFRIAGRVAADGTSVANAFTGTIDEVRVWNVARTGAQIAAAMDETINPSDATLVSYWRFDDGSGLTASDEEGRYPGTLVAGPVWVPSTAF
jgi:hypothetical protein